MALSSRLWQFMCGFLSYEFFVLLHIKNEGIPRLLLSFLTYTIFSILTIGLFLPFIADSQLNRLLITLIASFFLILSEKDNVFFNLISEIGNVSYSIYLIHWILIELHKYVNLEIYVDSGGFLPLEETIMLFTISILLGFLIEKAYEILSVRIRSWKTLIFTTLALYLMIFESLFYLKLNESDVDVSLIEDLMYPL